MDAGIEHLIRLQAVDEQIGKLLSSIAELPKHLAHLEQKLGAQKSALADAEKSISAAEVSRRRIDSDKQDLQQKIAKYRGQSNSVKTNEEFKALQNEIDFAQAEIKKLEDHELRIMEQVETLQAAKAQATQSLAEQSSLIEQEKESAKVQNAEQQAQLAALRQEREAHRAGVDASVLAIYDRVSNSSRKTGLARVQGQRCLGCQMYLRPQIWNQVRGGQLLTCESCARLLYFDISLEPPPPPPPPVKKKRATKAKVAVEEAEASLAE